MTENTRRLQPEPVDSASGPVLPIPGPLEAAFLRAVHDASAALDLADPVGAVHDLRKAFKRLRALLRLVQASRHRKTATLARELRRALAQTARLLAGARDVAARRDALDDLVTKGGLSPAARRAAGRALTPADGADGEAGLTAHRAELQLVLARLSKAVPQLGAAGGEKDLVTTLAREFAKTRRTGRAVDPHDDESLHELRKAVVAQRYQMELLIPAWPVLGEAWVDELQRLRDKLGKHHDLSVLRALIEARSVRGAGPPAWRAPLLESIEARQSRLAHSALRMHARLFAETPKAFRRRLAAYMSAVSEGK